MFESFFDDDFFAPFGRLDRHLGRNLFRPFGLAARRTSFPLVNVYTDADGALVTAEVPGVAAEDLELEVHGSSLTLKGSRGDPASGEDENLLRQERVTGGFQKTLQLPFRVDPEQVEAEVARGVLTVRLARPEEDKPRKITVKVTG